MKTLSDISLIQQYLSTEKEKYITELINRYSTLVFGVCMKYLKHEEDSKDLSIQVFQKVINKIKEHEIEYFKSWLYRLTVNECLMFLRKKGATTIPLDQVPIMENTPNEHLTNEDKEIQLTILEKCLEKLKVEQKQSVELFYLKELSYQQVVEQTGFDLKKVKSYIQNGKRNLKNCMEASE